MELPEKINFEANPDEAGVRLDVFLTGRMPELTRSYIQKIIMANQVEVHNKSSKIPKANYKIALGDVIQVTLPEAKPPLATPEDIAIDILYEDSQIIVVNKPRGMVVHPAAGNYEGTLVNALLNHCRDLSGINGVLRPGIVHRLDKDTSGVMVAAKSDQAHLNLAEQIKTRTAGRIYQAIVHGHIKESRGIIDAPIGRHPTERKKMAVTFNNSKEASTNFYVKEYFDKPGKLGKYTLLECKLLTGRTHQIRVHLAYIGHPVAGDPKYSNQPNYFKIKGQALHSRQLNLKHPETGKEMVFTAPMPEDMLDMYRILKVEI